MSDNIPASLRRIASNFRTERLIVRATGDHEIAEELSAAISHIDAASKAIERWSKKYEPKVEGD